MSPPSGAPLCAVELTVELHQFQIVPHPSHIRLVSAPPLGRDKGVTRQGSLAKKIRRKWAERPIGKNEVLYITSRIGLAANKRRW